MAGKGGDCDLEPTHVVVGPHQLDDGTWTLMGVPVCKRHIHATVAYLTGFFPDPTGEEPVTLTFADYEDMLGKLHPAEAADIGWWILEAA